MVGNMIWLGTLIWIVWFAAFLAIEANGFRRTHDRWPTFSELVKKWEANGPTIKPNWHSPAWWTWQRWFVAAGLPVVAIVLELHFVWEVF